VPATAPAAKPAAKVAFFGTEAQANHVVYVIDRSGSMLDAFDDARRGLLVSISKLEESQDFHVMLFADGPPIEMADRGLVAANKEHEYEAADFLARVRAEGQTDPIPALARAFEVLAKADAARPDKAILLLTDGDFPDNAALLKWTLARNKDKKVAIYTVLFGHRTPTAVEVMKKIAAESGGTYRYVGEE
jgi:uncharacterized protein with von Willebrand factor type A (vWA) domain